MMHAMLAALAVTAAATQVSTGTAPELGRVRFGRDVDAALETAAASSRPVFLLFQEIPGCSTCKSFGAGPLSHPLLVEAIETLFVPVVIHNNGSGADAKALQRFGEPAWNNPVVRFLGPDGRDLMERKDRIWSSAEIAARLVAALRAQGRPVPPWLGLVQAELDRAERVVFAMHCFWEGQAALGGIDGVLDATPGFVDGAEVVAVSFRPEVVAFDELVRKADALDCALSVSSADPTRVAAARALVGERARRLAGIVRSAKPGDDLRHLGSARALALAPLTRGQAVRVNAALAGGQEVPTGLLSPRQLELVAKIERALRERGAVLDGLVRPAAHGDLAGYVDELLRRIGDE